MYFHFLDYLLVCVQRMEINTYGALELGNSFFWPVARASDLPLKSLSSLLRLIIVSEQHTGKPLVKYLASGRHILNVSGSPPPPPPSLSPKPGVSTTS